MSNLLVIGNSTGSRHYRSVPGVRRAQENGHSVILAEHDDPKLSQVIDWADVVVFQMSFSPELIREAKRAGKRVVVEADDLLHKVPSTHYSYGELKGWGGIKWWWRVFRCLRQADGFVCTNEELARRYGWMCRRTLVWPNRCDLIHWLKPVRKNGGDRVRILWAGSTSHTGDLDFIKPVIKRVLARYPQAQFIYIGHGGTPSDDLYTNFIYGDDLFADLPRGQRESMLAVPSVVWPYVLNGLAADIAIAPLERNDFNLAKSQCKFLEYGVNALPGVYSKWFYTDVRDGVDGLLADAPEEWEACLSKLVESATLREEMGAAARERVIGGFDARPHLDNWVNFVMGEGTK